eukprot:CAMPEP_0173066392 /NCGR_PEP_ID=MMETSP1102-20130122/6179_1 /TAXON_ID=49646 /ORGANISM="Geminigera sp., Strain Caron Lab Isolate" /LENGTH=42 /DNA_ID= /DNA_START= /DNA_END= /DNA_ORIENTATION=
MAARDLPHHTCVRENQSDDATLEQAPWRLPEPKIGTNTRAAR